MKYQKERLVLIISIICSIFLSTFLWKHISFPYSDPKIIGVYSLSNHDAKNDIFRYFSFIGLPLITYLAIKFIYNSNFLQKIKVFLKKDNSNVSTSKDVFVVFLIILTFLFFDFLSINFPEHKIDSYHDGQRLSSAYKSLIDGSLWSGSYVTVGIFYETLATKFIWQIFQNISIGLSRYSDLLLIFFLKFSLLILSLLLTNFITLDKYLKKFFFLINSFVFLSLGDYDLTTIDLITFRELPIVVLLILFIALLMKKQQTLILLSISLLSLFSIIWGIDRGLVCNLLIVVILIYLFFKEEYKKIFILSLFICLSWITFYFTFQDEFYHFKENTISIYKEMNYVHGLIHPTPFSQEPNSSRATKTLISIIFCLIFSVSLIFKSEKKFSNLFKKILLLLAITSFGSYLYALGRSDGAHIKHVFGFPIIFFSIYFSYLLLYKISKSKIYLSKLSKNLFTFLLILIFVFFPIRINFNNINNYETRFKEFVKMPDEFFLNKKEISLKEKTLSLVKDYNCIQLFSNDAAFYYILRKKSCTKYYFIWSASSFDKQKKIVAELKNTNFIIANGPKDYWDIPLNKKLYLVDQHIKKNFLKHDSISFWDIYLRK